MRGIADPPRMFLDTTGTRGRGFLPVADGMTRLQAVALVP